MDDIRRASSPFIGLRPSVTDSPLMKHRNYASQKQLNQIDWKNYEFIRVVGKGT